jgi:hypothetical protein
VRARAALGASGARVAPMARLAAAVQVMFTLCSSRLASPALAATFPPRFDTYTVATTGSVQRVYVRDVDGDGLVDIASASDATDVVAWYKNGGGHTVGTPWAHQQQQVDAWCHGSDCDGCFALSILHTRAVTAGCAFSLRVHSQVAWFQPGPALSCPPLLTGPSVCTLRMWTEMGSRTCCRHPPWMARCRESLHGCGCRAGEGLPVGVAWVQ